MFRYIFKNYDNFLEKIRKALISLFKFKQKNSAKKLSPIEEVELEIKRQQENLEEKSDAKLKYKIIEKIVILNIKKLFLSTKNGYIHRAYEIAKDFNEDRLYETLNYLNSIAEHKLEQEKLKEIYKFKALIYELLDDYYEVSKAYKKAIELDSSPQTIKDFKEFMNRYQLILKLQQQEKSVGSKKIDAIHNIVPVENLPKVAQRLENLAKYYARSPKSRHLAKQYFKEVLKIYKKLTLINKNEYICEYIRVLLEGVEEFMFSPVFLKEALEILADPKICFENRIYLLEKIKELKEKKFIQKSSLFN